MNGDPTKGIEDIVRRNIAAFRSKANLTQQGLADEMLLRGVAWTRETVAQVETTSRRLGFTEAIVVAACLDVPVARLAATGQTSVVVGEGEWSAAYLGAAIAGTAGDIFPPESYATPLVRPARAPRTGTATDPRRHSRRGARSAPGTRRTTGSRRRRAPDPRPEIDRRRRPRLPRRPPSASSDGCDCG